MARAKKGKEVDTSDLNVIDLGKELGLGLMTDSNRANITNVIPTMVPQYDSIMGGGLPLGRLVEVYGIPGSGKSTFAVHLSKLTTEMGVITVWIDVEGTADNNRMEQLGVDVSKLFTIQAGEGRLKKTVELSVEQVGKELEYWIDTFNEKKPEVPIVFIWDSLGATRTEKEIENGIDEKQMAQKAVATQKVVNAITPKLNETNTGVIIINQARDDLKAGMYGDPVKSGGGKAFEHAASLRLKIDRGREADYKQVDELTGEKSYRGHLMKVTTKKSKLSRPGQTASTLLASDYQLEGGLKINGIDPEFMIYQEAVNLGLITKGTWRNYVTLNGEEVKLYDKDWVPRLKDDRELYLEIFKRVYVAYFPNGFSPLDNTKVDVTILEEFKVLQEFYEELAKEEPKGESTERDSDE